MTRAFALLLAAGLALSPSAVAAQPEAGPGAPATGPLGLTVSADLGGGGTLGRGTDSSHGLFEGELGVGYDLGAGLRPEAALVLGFAPEGHVGLRAGLHYGLPGVPFYVRGAFDWSTLLRDGSWRWLLVGGGAELWITDVMGGFAELDLGLPLGRDIGVGVLFRAGASFRF